MKTLILLASLLLCGCATTVLVPKDVMPAPPALLMVAPADLKPIPEGSVKADDALTLINDNNAITLGIKEQLIDLQSWITQTQQNIATQNNKK